MRDNFNNFETWRQQWDTVLKSAQKCPAMYISEQATAHLISILMPLRLVWEAKAFRRPVSASILLSPTRYIVRCFTGPLVRPIQQMFSWEDKHILDEGWNEPIEQLRQERFNRAFYEQPHLRGWRNCFGSAMGPLLNSPMLPRVLAQKFAIGYRTNKGMWCQTFESGWPLTAPFLLQAPSPVGLLAAAELDAQWFTGIPFDIKDVEYFSAIPHVTVDWHASDDLLEIDFLSSKGLLRWL